LIGRDYREGHRFWNAARLAAELDVPSTALAPVLTRLERGGLILATEEEQLVPGRDPERILLSEILDAVRNLQIGRLTVAAHGVTAVTQVMCEAESAMRERLGKRSLKDLIVART
jgi:DNA-binding IscR family transcriptional regulator